MSSKQIFFFSEASDIKSIIEIFESLEKIKYYQTGLFDLRNTPNYSSLLEVRNLGFAESGDWNHCRSYLILPKDIPINIRDIPQRSGGVKYAVDQKANPKSIIIKPGGVYKEFILVGGSAGTVSNDEFSIRVFNTISQLIKKNFYKVETFYVGSSAKLKLEQGWRLVTNDKSPKEYDLKLS